MMEMILRYSDSQLIALFASVFGLSGIFLFWIAFTPRLTKTVDKFVGVGLGFYGPVTTMFAFTAAFLGSSVWGNFQHINTAVGNERIAITSYRYTLASSDDLQASGLEAALFEYVESALHDEWPLLSDGEISLKTNKAFLQLMVLSSKVAQRPELNPITSGMLVRATESLRVARLTRTGFRFYTSESTRWYAVLLLGILVQLAVMVTHLENRKKAPMATALTIMSALIFSTVTLIAMSVQPFEGLIQVSRLPLETAIAP